MVAFAGVRWCAYTTFAGAEELAARELARSGYVPYAPLVRERWRDVVIESVWHTGLRPRFPGYGFVQLTASQPWLPVHRGADGVAGLLLGPDGKPEPVLPGQVELCQDDDDRLCGLAPEVLPMHRAGLAVLIEAGAFRGRTGLTAECNGMTTTVQLLVFGRLVGVKVDRGSVRAFAEVAA